MANPIKSFGEIQSKNSTFIKKEKKTIVFYNSGAMTTFFAKSALATTKWKYFCLINRLLIDDFIICKRTDVRAIG